MEQLGTLFLFILLTWSYFQYRKERGLMFYQKPEREVRDGCRGYLIAAAVVIFLAITLIFQKELLEVIGKKFIQ